MYRYGRSRDRENEARRKGLNCLSQKTKKNGVGKNARRANGSKLSLGKIDSSQRGKLRTADAEEGKRRSQTGTLGGG